MSSITFTDDEIFTVEYKGMKSSGKIRNFINKLGDPNPGKLGGLLPPVVRYIDHTNKLLIWERRPTYVNVRFKNAPRNCPGKVQAFKIFIPWTVYICDGTFTQLYFRNEALESLNNEVYAATVPNMNGNRVCQYVQKETSRDIFANCMAFWSTEFNTNAYPVPNAAVPSCLKEKDYTKNTWANTFAIWQTMSPTEVLNIKWITNGTLKSKLPNSNPFRKEITGTTLINAALATSSKDVVK